jgi:hypothetical protein
MYACVYVGLSRLTRLCGLSVSAVSAAAAAGGGVSQAAADGQAFPPITASKQEVVDAAVAWVHGAIAQDRKVGALKQLQGHVWRDGFKKGELIAQVFRCVWGGEPAGPTAVGIVAGSLSVCWAGVVVLKQLQGHVLCVGFKKGERIAQGELIAQLFRCVGGEPVCTLCDLELE